MGEVELGGGDLVGAPVVPRPLVVCLRCGGESTVRLEKTLVGANTCYRCRGCGHIFSPVGTVGE
jgi:hypothetical protein